MADAFTFSQPVKILFGEKSVGRLREVFSQFHIDTCVMVCDPFFTAYAAGLQKENPEIAAIFSGVEPNPQLSGARTAAMLARGVGAQAIVALGGGSSIDTAKFAAAITRGEKSAEEYLRMADFPENPLKIIAIPTTAGTGSEVTQVSVMSDGSDKHTINHPAFMPVAAIIDPELTYSMPPRATMICGLDALAHALEGYWSVHHQPMTDLFAVEATRLILENLERACANGSDREARANMAYAATLGGLSFSQTKTAACHALSYPLSMRCHLPHGEACAFTLDALVKVNADARLNALARKAGLKDTDELAESIARFKRLASLARTLGDLKGDPDLPAIAAEAAAHPLTRNNPVPLDAEKLLKLLEGLR